MRNQNQMEFQFNKGTLEEICEVSNLGSAQNSGYKAR